MTDYTVIVLNSPTFVDREEEAEYEESITSGTLHLFMQNAKCRRQKDGGMQLSKVRVKMVGPLHQWDAYKGGNLTLH